MIESDEVAPGQNLSGIRDLLSFWIHKSQEATCLAKGETFSKIYTQKTHENLWPDAGYPCWN